MSYKDETCTWLSSIVTWLRAGRQGVRFLAGVGIFSFRNQVQTGSGAHPASYSIYTCGSFPRGKAFGAWSWPLTSIYCTS